MAGEQPDHPAPRIAPSTDITVVELIAATGGTVRTITGCRTDGSPKERPTPKRPSDLSDRSLGHTPDTRVSPLALKPIRNAMVNVGLDDGRQRVDSPGA